MARRRTSHHQAHNDLWSRALRAVVVVAIAAVVLFAAHMLLAPPVMMRLTCALTLGMAGGWAVSEVFRIMGWQ